MRIGFAQKVATGSIAKGLSGVAATALLATVTLTSVPTTASAFNIGGLIGTAMALQYGGHYGRSYSHHARRESSRHHHEYAGRGRDHESSGQEKDATEVDATDPGNSVPDSKVSTHRQPSGPVQNNTLQASESDARARVVSDEPTFAPSR